VPRLEIVKAFEMDEARCPGTDEGGAAGVLRRVDHRRDKVGLSGAPGLGVLSRLHAAGIKHGAGVRAIKHATPSRLLWANPSAEQEVPGARGKLAVGRSAAAAPLETAANVWAYIRTLERGRGSMPAGGGQPTSMFAAIAPVIAAESLWACPHHSRQIQQQQPARGRWSLRLARVPVRFGFQADWPDPKEAVVQPER
jgi:hypothetical protein